MKIEGKSKSFAAANTSEGFKSCFEEIFFSPNISKRYILKGGPGTGKSSFLSRVALAAEKKGHEIEYFYCSSDTHSLDGVVIDKSTALFDGTAPHSYDTLLAGVCDNIINLGEFWSSDKLFACKNDIIKLNKCKKDAYSRAYGYLSAAGKIQSCMQNMRKEFLLCEKLSSSAVRAYEGLGLKKSTGRVHTRQMTAYGTGGKVHFDTLLNMADTVYNIEDFYGTAGAFLSELLRKSRENGTECLVSFDNLSPSTPSEIYFPDASVYFGVTDGEGDKNINMKRFANTAKFAKIRPQYRAAERVRDTACSLALSELARAGEAHAELEGYYVSSMDFSRQSEYCTNFIEGLEL